MNSNVILAHFCYVARFHVTNKFIGSHLIQRGWKKLFSDSNDHELYSGKAIQQYVSAFLGASRDTNGIVSSGSCYSAQVCDLISAFNNKFIKFVTNKGPLPLQLNMHPMLYIHLSPGGNAGLFVMAFDLPSHYPDLYEIDDVIELNYMLQKIDNQAPRLVLAETGASEPGFETLTTILHTLLPEDDYTLSERFRLHPAVYIQTPLAADPDYDELVYLSAGQNKKYLITDEDKESIEALYKNIHTSCRREGFVVCSENPEPQKQNTFESQFLATFRGSYLPLYLQACLADYSLMNYLQEMSAGRITGTQSEQLRELRLVESLPASSFTHLNKLATLINHEVFTLPAKVESISSYLDNARFETRSRSNRRLNLCVMALTVSQVIFALIQYLGIKDILGEHPQPFQTYSIIVVAATLLMVIALIVPWEKFK